MKQQVHGNVTGVKSTSHAFISSGLLNAISTTTSIDRRIKPMLRILPHFFFFKEGAPFVVIPAYCTTNPRLS